MQKNIQPKSATARQRCSSQRFMEGQINAGSETFFRLKEVIVERVGN